MPVRETDLLKLNNNGDLREHFNIIILNFN